FFSFFAGLNIYIAYELPLDVWVNFKVFGMLIATFAYMIATGVYIYKHMPKEEKNNSSDVSVDD
ncbi:septation protein IspZ, partial [Vibrio sp. Vb0667]